MRIPNTPTPMQKYTIEFIGTFFLVLTFGLVSVYGNAGYFAPVAVGLIYAVMIYTGAHLPGVHYFNPAVTLAILIRGKVPAGNVPWYVVAQLAGAAAGIVTAKAIFPGQQILTFAAEDFLVQVLIAEFVFTFALVWVVLLTATFASNKGNPFAGLCIGSVLIVGGIAVADASLGVFNPAVALGLLIGSQISATGFVLYFGAQAIAGVGAALTVTNLFSEEELK